MAAPLILAEAQPRRVADGVPVVVRLAGGGGALPLFYGGNHYRAGLTGLPKIVTSSAFDGTDLGGSSVPQSMELRWAPSNAAALAELAAYHWNDAAITVRVGLEGSLPPVLTSGTVIGAASDAGALAIALSDPAADLRKPILTARFAGTGGIEGPIEWKGRIKRRVWGRVFNLPGDPIDKANSIYCFGDPQFAWAEFVEVRDKGAAPAPSAVTVLAWQGSVAATFAALQVAAAPQGGGVLCPSIACVKWWTQPAGALCADIRGEIGAGYVEILASIAERIAGVTSAVPFAAGTVAAANVARPIAAGFVAGDENVTAAAALDSLFSDVSLLWVLDNDAIVIRRWEWTAPVASARSVDVSRKQSFKPVSRRKLGYRRNQNVMSRDSIAGIVFVSDIAFDDGEALHDRLAAMAQATEAVELIASGKVATFFQPTPPLAAESKEGDLWFDTANGNFLYRRLGGNGRISIGGIVVTFGGSAIVYRPWAPAPDQRVATALAQAATAIQQAQAAQATADDAIGSITAMADDGVLAGVEKKQLIIDDSRLQGAWTILDAQAGQLGITAERIAAATARTNWLALRNAIVPAWNDTDSDSPVDRTSYVTTLNAYATALTTLQKAINAKVATTADWNGVTGAGKDQLVADAATAKSNAAIAIGQITIIQSDGYLAAGEKRDIKARVADIQAEYPGMLAKAAAQGISSTVYQAAYAALLAYLATLSPAWDNSLLDTAIAPATFNGKFSDYYYAKADLQIASADLTAPNTPSITGPMPLNFSADYLGQLDSGQVPQDFPYKRLRGATDVTSSTAWSIIASDGVAVSIGAADGVAHVTAVTKDAGSFTIRSVYAGVTRDQSVTVQRNRAAAPVNTGSTGNPGTSGSVLANGSTGSTDYGGAESAPFTCVAGTAGQVALASTLNVSLYATSGMLSQYGYAMAQWRLPGGTWADVAGSECLSDGPATYDKFEGSVPTTLTFGATKTGLTSGTTYEFRLKFRKASGTSGQIMSFSGTFAGTGS